jgi:MerR family transcriptional regulator/heat shock protein HspR
MHISSSAAVYVISVAADLAGMHPQTLRQYDRLGLVTPERTAGRGRRYSGKDIAKLRMIQQLSQDEGVNLVGIKKIIDLQNQVDALRYRNEELEDEIRAQQAAKERDARVFAAGTAGDVVSIARGRRPQGRPEPGALVLYNRYRRR